jgi:hypothetical protein
MLRPEWWNALHDRALGVLTDTWQNVATIRGPLSVVAFDDLVVAGVADRRYESLTSPSGRPAGQHIWFKRRAGA